ncbi:MAG: BBP7 family outer membrane beta-barrel protein [Planctomycetales bacterium]|nr:BBP7 family outer membrane beta-barrel protein [Planctomycetales bacterium]MBN8627681.1 BBP7 family outer membrane beta-barrel protein [Planctomycetota bacterium]
MSIKPLLRRSAAILGLALSANTVAAQGLPSSVSEPEFVPYVEDLQLFEQPDLSPYGRGVRPPEGWFGSVEFLNLSVGAPSDSTIGSAAVPTQAVFGVSSTTVNTGSLTVADISNGGVQIPAGTVSVGGPGDGATLINPFPQINNNENAFSADFTTGSRFEFGRLNNGAGWFVSTFTLGTQSQDESLSDASVNFVNQPIGFVDISGPNVAPTPGNFNNARFLGDGYDDDLDGDGVFGRHGRDRGTQAGAVFNNPLDGIPDRESQGFREVPIDWDDAVRLPTIFATLDVQNRTGVWGVETMRAYRLEFSPHGGTWELFFGPRYLNIDDTYIVTGIARNTNPTYYQNPLGDSQWYTNAQNHLFGAQLGGRWFKQNDRWQLSVETRLFATANFQNVQQDGNFGTLNDTVVIGGVTVPRRDDVINMQLPASFHSQTNLVEFSPGMEMRFNLKYQVFRSVYLQLGYTAMYAENIARASRMVRYELPGMGIDTSQNKDGLFMNGVNFGVIVNR